MPRSVHDKARKVQAVMRELEQSLGQPPSDAEMAKNLETFCQRVSRSHRGDSSSNLRLPDASPVSDDEESRHDRIADESQPDPMDLTARREVSAIIA